MIRIVAIASLVLLASGCASTATDGAHRSATVTLAPASGSQVRGSLQAMPMGDGVHFTGTISGLGPGATHAIHVHQRGDCSAPDATSAGDHFNPTAQPHGRPDNGAHHEGDMPNLVADAGGTARVDMHVRGLALGTGAAGDIAGRAVIVHAKADDYASQPSGNAGGRIACGVVATAR